MSGQWDWEALKHKSCASFVNRTIILHRNKNVFFLFLGPSSPCFCPLPWRELDPDSWIEGPIFDTAWGRWCPVQRWGFQVRMHLGYLHNLKQVNKSYITNNIKCKAKIKKKKWVFHKQNKILKKSPGIILSYFSVIYSTSETIAKELSFTK